MIGTRAFYFSATGGTEAVLDGFLQGMANAEKICLNRPIGKIQIPADKLAIFAAPVYEGRIAPVIAERFRDISGNGGPAVVIVVYGHRAYEDALVELRDIMTENGFKVIAAASFLAAHSAHARLAAGKPDSDDLALAADFSKTIVEKITSGSCKEASPRGNRPYRATRAFNVTPICKDSCNTCGICVTKCPQLAIAKESPTKTDPTLCMACLACIKYCPQKARQIPKEYRDKYDVFLEQFITPRQEPELF